MKYILIMIFAIILGNSIFAKDDEKNWKNCQRDAECKIDHELACGNFCYNKNFERQAFEWAKTVDWECMLPINKLVARCVKTQCSCVEASKKFPTKAVKEVLGKPSNK